MSIKAVPDWCWEQDAPYRLWLRKPTSERLSKPHGKMKLIEKVRKVKGRKALNVNNPG
jgi:hypothetical protein